MCDTLAALGNYTQSGNLVFGKNSDREPLEAQEIRHFSRKTHTEKTVPCTFITIPQVDQTWEVFLSKPFQMWGAEMGVNEWGLTIGNEAVFTQVKINKKKPGLTGMDMLRLALERCKKANEAKNLIIQLLSIYGQDACGGYQNKDFYYHNSFLIADSKEAYILETAGKSWAWKKVRDTASISNCLSLDEDYDEIFLEKEATHFSAIFRSKKGFKSRFSDFLYTYFSKARSRKATTTSHLENYAGQLSTWEFMKTLRTHPIPDDEFHPKNCSAASICMHATGLTNPSDTTGSMVTEIRQNQPSTIWLTGTPHPCLSLYVPFYFGTITDFLTFPVSKMDDSLWWQARQLHDLVDKNRIELFPKIRQELDNVQNEWIKKDSLIISENPSRSDLQHFSQECYRFYQDWIKQKIRDLR
ncbi:peptidase U34 [Algoriphagus kandeliae]|uniref:Peptidase U34 n=1 Tax=Algoriphagus kandeliae TaxID=2562278 RepID=A0A4Y9QNN6_9BACT|nr:carcinine hydrolase/isopenicillin-N N-acyltransferase family protein [Algoriphagus kandeliae]TFV94254.1 peptidase U34 [Algoriphagus kandeliae]